MKNDTPLRAVRAFCTECSGGTNITRLNCTKTDCSLYTYRNGTNPKRIGIGGKHNVQYIKTQPCEQKGYLSADFIRRGGGDRIPLEIPEGYEIQIVKKGN